MSDEREGGGHEGGFFKEHPLLAMAAGAFLWRALTKRPEPKPSTKVPEDVDWTDDMERWAYLNRDR